MSVITEPGVTQVEPCPFVSPRPGYLRRGTLTPARAVCGSGVTNTLGTGESFQPEPPEKSCRSPRPRGVFVLAARVRDETVRLKNSPPAPQNESLSQ